MNWIITILLNVRCFLGFHSWTDSGWLRFIKKTGILECGWCGKIKKRRSK